MVNQRARDPHRAKNRGHTLSQSSSQSEPSRESISSGQDAGTTVLRQQPNEEFDYSNWSEDEDGGTRVAGIYIPPPVVPYCSTESKGPRLIIKKIENFNFKSYAGRVILGPFHQCFTAIIGPNGSGKSNVIDSMLFVFGYRANKIRCKKLSTLLHNSAKFPDRDSCSVAVHFGQIIDHEDGTCEDVPKSEIVISRTAFRDNSSYYEVNGRKVQFREVARILKHHNIDLDHNRFLILQGEVESIAMMKPKALNDNECGMLEYLEDIVGTSRYKEPLKQIFERVCELTDERTQKHNRCTLAEREMKDLEKPYNDALQYLRLENDNTRTKNIRIQIYMNEKINKFEEYSAAVETIVNELKVHDESDLELQKQRQEKELIIQEELKYFEKLRGDKENIEKRLEQANSNFTEIQQLMTVKNQQRKKNKTQLEKNQDDLVELKKIPVKNQKEIDECEKKVEQLTAKKTKAEDELQENYAKLEKQTKPLIEQREALETELIDLKNAVDEAKREVTVSEAELRLLQQNELTEVRKYESLKTSYQDSEDSLNEKRAQLAETQKTLPQIAKTVTEKRRQLKRLQEEEEQMTRQLMSLRNEINEKMATIQTSRSNNKVLDFLMRKKNEGLIPGILGRLGDLGGINAKYDVAISTACGRLDNIVVDTVDTAQLCIKALKDDDVGRASFIALEKVYHYGQQSGKIKTPENAPRLYDLVTVEDERVLPAFYFALRNTLVATDLEQGTLIAYGARRYRVVTLKGDLIEISGTMSGGGRMQIRGKMASTVQTKTKYSSDSSVATEKALEDMQVNAESLQSKINFNQEEQGRIEREVHALERQHQELEANVQKLSITIKSLTEQLPRINDQLEKQKQRMLQTKTDAEKVKTLEADIKKKQQKLEKSEEAADKVIKQINDIKEQIDKIHGDKIKVVQTNINNINNQIKKLNANMSKLKVDITTSERNVSKLEKNIDQLQAEILKAQDDLKELSQQRQKFDDETVQLSKDLEGAKTAMETAKSGTSTVHDEIKEIEKQENAKKLKRVEIEQRLKEMSAMRADMKSQIPHWQAQLKPLKLHDIPGETDQQTPLKTYTEEELNTYNLQDIQYKESVQEELLKKKPNLSCINEYIEKRSVYLERVKVLEDITMKRNEMRKLLDDVKKKRFNEFMQGFHIITRKLKEMYQMITQGGDAELELVDSMDPFTEGVSFSVRPPKKSWKNISNLSGGEKTLSSLALVFALHYYKPSPLYFMDEIDAALDFKNISIVAHYIKERTKNAQFIIISLRSNMFELSDVLVGIYKVEDCTDSLALVNDDSYSNNLPRFHSNADENANNPVNDGEQLAQADETNLLNATPRDSTFAPQVESTQLIQEQKDNSNLANKTSDMFKRPMPPCSASVIASPAVDATELTTSDTSTPTPMDTC